MTEPTPSDQSLTSLHDLGWSCGDVAFYEDKGIVWVVYAHRGDQKVVARAPLQRDAWDSAAEQAERLKAEHD